MAIAFACQCGREFKVDDKLAGKSARCKHCGQMMRIPALTVQKPDLDIYGLEDLQAAQAPVEETIIPRQQAKPETKAAKSNKGFARIFEALPRDEDLRYLIFGGVVLGFSLVMCIVGGFVAVITFLFVAFAAPVCFLWASLSGLRTALEQSIHSALKLLPSLLATATFFYVLSFPHPKAGGPLASAAVAILGFAGFLATEKRVKNYRTPVALGIMSALLLVSFTIMLHVARYQLARQGGANLEPLEIASAPPVDSPETKQAPADPIARALRTKKPLPEARRGFQTHVERETARQPIDNPPPNVFGVVRFKSPVGELMAYLSPDPGDGQKHPAIVWITGGDCNSIGDVWTPADPRNDQSASAYRKAGLVMMFPSLRGGNLNPGQHEGFLGEVDDVLAAADFLAKQEYVDPERIYLGGHSTGGTLALLVAESTDRFRAVFSFGPVNDVRGYSDEYTPFSKTNQHEVLVRSPGYWLHSVRCPTFVFEGETGNIDCLKAMERDSKNPLLHFLEVKGADHFSILAPMNGRIAASILQDTGPTTNLRFDTTP